MKSRCARKLKRKVEMRDGGPTAEREAQACEHVAPRTNNIREDERPRSVIYSTKESYWRLNIKSYVYYVMF